ncbi:hypothetical protein [Pseudolactococcus yaeyamensis]
MDDNAFIGSNLINANSQRSYFNNAKKVLSQKFEESQAQFVTLNDLYKQLGNNEKETIT